MIGVHFFVCCTCFMICTCEYAVYLNEYIVQTSDGDISIVKTDLQKLDLRLKKKINLGNFYLFERNNQKNISTTADTEFTKRLQTCCGGKIIPMRRIKNSDLDLHPDLDDNKYQFLLLRYIKVIAAEQVVESFKRLWPKPPLPVDDTSGDDDSVTPLPQTPAYEMIGVPEVWSSGITGKGVLIAVTDVGINIKLPDLSPNIAKAQSYNVIVNTTDITPEYDGSYPEMESLSDHGSNCAGLIAAVRNSKCGDGVTYGAKVAGLKIFEIKWSTYAQEYRISYTDERTAAGLSHAAHGIDVYSNSWSSTQNFEPHHFGILSQQALKHGINVGRRGKGSIYVFPVGAVADGFNNSPFTISVNEVITDGKLRKDALACACTLTSTYGAKSIPSAILKTATSYRYTNCTEDFVGTSAATAIIAGSIGLALEANKNLTWRDIQHLVVETSERINVWDRKEFKRNGAGKFFHDKLGFGILNVKKMVALAKDWPLVNQRQCETMIMSMLKECSPCSANVHVNRHTQVDRIEHVIILLSYTTPFENKTKLTLQSPNGTVSVLIAMGQSGTVGATERQNVTLSTVHFWGELASGTWILILEHDTDSGYRSSPKLTDVNITLCGTKLVGNNSLTTEANDDDNTKDDNSTATTTTSQPDTDIEWKLGIVIGIPVGFVVALVITWLLSCWCCHDRLKKCPNGCLSGSCVICDHCRKKINKTPNKPDAAWIPLLTKVVEIPAGENVTLECPRDSHTGPVVWEGPPKFTLYFNNQGVNPQLPEDIRTRVSTNTDHDLLIQHVSVNDGGFFRCKITDTVVENMEVKVKPAKSEQDTTQKEYSPTDPKTDKVTTNATIENVNRHGQDQQQDPGATGTENVNVTQEEQSDGSGANNEEQTGDKIPLIDTEKDKTKKRDPPADPKTEKLTSNVAIENDTDATESGEANVTKEEPAGEKDHPLVESV